LHPIRRPPEENRPVSRLPRRSYLLAPVLAVAVGLSVAGCGSGGVAVQSKEHSNAAGASGDVGSIQVRDAVIMLGIGTQATLDVALFNQGMQADSLTGVTSPDASSFTLPTGALAPAIGGPENPTSSAASTSVAASPGPVTVQAQNGVFLDSFATQIVIAGLSGAPTVGQSLPVTFTFAAAGSLTLQVPIVAANAAATSASPLPSVTGAGIADGPPSSTPPVTVTATVTDSGSAPAGGATLTGSPIQATSSAAP
jgi:copper(I)-binding protein